MTKLVRYAVLLSLLICAAFAAPAAAQSPGCQQLLPKGVYEGPTSVVMDVKGIENGVLLQEFTFNETGQLSLTIDCGAITAGTYHWNVHRTIMLVPGTTPVVCAYTVDFSQPTGNVVAGTNGQPRIDVRWGQGVVNPNDCIGPGPAETGATWRFSLSGPPQDRTISGDVRISYDDPSLQDPEDLAQIFRNQGFQVTLNKGWTLTRLPQPEVQTLNSTLRQFFLAGIPVTNRYIATIDWDSAPAGTARFFVGNDPGREMTVDGNIASFELPLGPIQRTGDIPLSVEAKLDDRVDRLDGLGPLTLVPVPAWAIPFNLQPQEQFNSVRYSGVFAVPTKPLDAHVVLPASLPFVGGAWGLLPTQFKVGLAANSSGAREPGSLSAQGGFSLGKRRFELAGRGNIFGTLQHDDLLFESDPLTLSTSGIFFQERLSLVSVIPGAASLFDKPVLGDFLRAVDSLGGITANVHGSMAGTGRLAVQGEKLALTEGRFDASLGVQAKANLNLLAAFIQLTGGGDGSLSMQVIPSPKVTKCEVLFSFQAQVGAFGFSTQLLNASHRFVACTSASGQTMIYSTNSASAMPELSYGGPPSREAERVILEERATNGPTETVLVENASVQAQPLLVSGPNGRLAFAWNSVGASGAADVVSLRLFDSANWGSAITVSQPNRPAFNPSAAFAANGNLLVAWTEAQTQPAPDALTEGFVRSFEIAWAELNPSTGAVISRGQLTSDNTMDFGPRLAAGKDGTVWLAWQSSPGMSLIGTSASPNRLQAARWTSSSWTSAEMVAPNMVGTLFWDVAAVDANRIWMVADVDVDGNLGTATDREIFVSKRTASGWAAPYRLTNDAVIDSGPLLALTPDDQPVLAWRHGESVIGLTGDPASTAPQTWFDDSASVGPMLGAGRLLAGAGGTRTLLWADGTEHGQDVWLSRFNSATQSWSLPLPLFQTPELRRSLSASLLPGGDIVLGLASAPVVNQTVTFEGGGTAQVPAVSDTARLLVARIPAGYIPSPEGWALFLPLVAR